MLDIRQETTEHFSLLVKLNNIISKDIIMMVRENAKLIIKLTQ